MYMKRASTSQDSIDLDIDELSVPGDQEGV